MRPRLPDNSVERIFADADQRWPVTAGSIAPDGEAEQVEGGWLVNGRWGWASGIHHSDYVLGQCRIPSREPEPGKPPPLVIVAAPKSDVVVEDTWHTLGMRGTGSTHYRFDDVFVPDEMCLVGFERPALRGGDWLQRPTVTFLTAAGYGFPLGVARRALEEITTLATAHTRTGQRASIAQQQHFQADLGRCAAQLDVMEGFGEHLFQELLTAPVRSLQDVVQMDDRARSGLRWAHQTAEQIVRTAHEHAGGPAVYSDNVLARLLRDIQTVSQHVIQTESAYIRRGQHQLGLEVRTGSVRSPDRNAYAGTALIRLEPRTATGTGRLARTCPVDCADDVADYMAPNRARAKTRMRVTHPSMRWMRLKRLAVTGPAQVAGLPGPSLSTQTEVFAGLSRIDMSAGWCTMIEAVTAGLVGVQLRDDEPIRRRLRSKQFPKVAGTAHPHRTEIEPCDGG